MPNIRHLIVLSYDVSDDRSRAKLADYLEAQMTRVQGSVFEGWMTRAEAERVAGRAARLVGDAASVRLYVIPRGAVTGCRAWGFPPAPVPGGLLIV